jgi:alpha-L-rhamnosidase
VLAVLVLLLGGAFQLRATEVTVTRLRCESLKDPLGIDVVQPRLSWNLEPTSRKVREARQSAYQVLVASTQDQLNDDQGDLWNTGRINSEQSIQVRYLGKPLRSGQACFWKVRVWDETGRRSAWSEPARWSMGLLQASDWHGKWIGYDGPESTLDTNVLGKAQWIWYPEGQPEKNAPAGTRYFRRLVVLPTERAVRRATLFVSADDSAEFFVNGQKVAAASNFHVAEEADVTGLLRTGKNMLSATVRNGGASPTPAGLVASLRVEFSQGEPLLLTTDLSWKASRRGEEGWQGVSFEEDNGWLASRELGAVGMAPWGNVSGPENRRLPARLLRREFGVEKKLQRATAYVCGLGLSEFYLNGEKVGDSVLSPALSDYTKRAFYVTYDVTKQLKRGRNAAGLLLGNGRFYAPRSTVPTGTTSYGYPKLMFQLRLEYADGSSVEVVSDETWKLATDGPIRANNEYDGEEYDARLEKKDWTKTGYDDRVWACAQVVSAPGGVLAAQMIAPIRVVQTLHPIAMSQPQRGVYVLDLGQNLVGWCRLRVSGPRGTEVSLRHAETLRPDGMIYLDNIRSAKVKDVYTLKGEGQEVYEPRFTYHGFRYVEVRGYPGSLRPDALEGCVVHDDVEAAGGFACSNPLLNRIYTNIVWGVRGNYRSIPTDCPQRDERQGWLGDRSAESKGETYLFDTSALYAKWLQDMADAQRPSGSVPDVCPAYWPIYSDNVTWPSSTVIIPGSLWLQFGDTGVVAAHYASAKKWMDYMTCFVTNGIIARDSYGDWCVPPEEQHLIHSNDPKRRTDRALLATAYFYHDVRLMARYATLLGKAEDARQFNDLADVVKAAFNEKFFQADAGQYDNGSQTSCVLPLAFGLVPEVQHDRVFSHLVTKLTEETLAHTGTGLIGGQWLMRVLSDNGRPDLAYTIASQRTYPSWGYMVQKGATTIWELWNGDTADPAMNSGNHVMLVGDLGIWLYEYLAGIRADPEQPGFKHIILRPEPVSELHAVKASHRSPYGRIVSEWESQGGAFRWYITVPPNTTATAYFPTINAETITESDKPLARVRGVKLLGVENNRAVLTLGSGTYRFESR